MRKRNVRCLLVAAFVSAWGLMLVGLAVFSVNLPTASDNTAERHIFRIWRHRLPSGDSGIADGEVDSSSNGPEECTSLLVFKPPVPPAPLQRHLSGAGCRLDGRVCGNAVFFSVQQKGYGWDDHLPTELTCVCGAMRRDTSGGRQRSRR